MPPPAPLHFHEGDGEDELEAFVHEEPVSTVPQHPWVFVTEQNLQQAGGERGVESGSGSGSGSRTSSSPMPPEDEGRAPPSVTEQAR